MGTGESILCPVRTNVLTDSLRCVENQTHKFAEETRAQSEMNERRTREAHKDLVDQASLFPFFTFSGLVSNEGVCTRE